jgi:hypothetical protein
MYKCTAQAYNIAYFTLFMVAYFVSTKDFLSVLGLVLCCVSVTLHVGLGSAVFVSSM